MKTTEKMECPISSNSHVNHVAKEIGKYLTQWKVEVNKIDLLIHVSDISQYTLGDACHIQGLIGATNAACYQLRKPYPNGIKMALVQADAFIASGIHQHVLVSLTYLNEITIVLFSKDNTPVVSHNKTLDELKTSSF